MRLQPVFTAAPSSTAEVDLCIEIGRRIQVRPVREDATFTALSQIGFQVTRPRAVIGQSASTRPPRMHTYQS
jgi:hypothetical protein